MSFDKRAQEYYSRQSLFDDENADLCESRVTRGLMGATEPIHEEYGPLGSRMRIPTGEYSRELNPYTKNVLPYARVIDGRGNTQNYTSSRHNLDNASRAKRKKTDRKRVNLFALFFSIGVMGVMCAMSAICFGTLASYTTYRRKFFSIDGVGVVRAEQGAEYVLKQTSNEGKESDEEQRKKYRSKLQVPLPNRCPKQA